MTEFTRRKFIKKTGLAAGASTIGFPAIVSGQNLNSKIRVACIGVGGKGSSDTDNAAREGGEIVALCDVDLNTLGKKAQKFPKATKFQDFRKMLEKMETRSMRSPFPLPTTATASPRSPQWPWANTPTFRSL